MGIPSAAGRQQKTYTAHYIYKPVYDISKRFPRGLESLGKKIREFQFAPEILQNIIYSTVYIIARVVVTRNTRVSACMNSA